LGLEIGFGISMTDIEGKSKDIGSRRIVGLVYVSEGWTKVLP